MLAQNAQDTPDDEEFFDAEDSPKEYIELAEKVKAEFSIYIEDSVIDNVLIYQSYRNNNSNLHASMVLQDNSTSIKISEFLNSKFCGDNKITDFSISDNDNRKIISGYVIGSEDGKKVRCYDLSNSSLNACELQFKWYVSGKECSVALSSENLFIIPREG